MFARITSALIALSLAVAVVAAPGAHNEVKRDQCNGGDVYCCNSFQDAKSLDANDTRFHGLADLDIKQLTGQVGLTCSPVDVLAVGGGSACSQQKVCCSDNKYNGVIVVGCTPINVSL